MKATGTLNDFAPGSLAKSTALRAAGICLAIAAIVAVVPYFKPEHSFVILMAAGMAVCLAVPLWYRWNRGELDWFEPVHTVSFLYFLAFGFGSVATVMGDQRPAYDLYLPQYIPEASFYSLLGLLAFLGGYYGPWFSKPPTIRFRNERPKGTVLVAVVGVVGLMGYLAQAGLQHTFKLGSQVNVVQSSMAQLSPLFIFAWALCWLLFFQGTLIGGQRIVLFGLLVPGVITVIYLTYGNKSLTMVLIGLPVVARWYVKHKIPWAALIALALILVFVIFPLYNTYRWFTSSPHAKRMALAQETVSNWSTDAYVDNSMGMFIRRIAVVNSLAIVVRDVGRWEDYAKGETIFMPVVESFIPRVIWGGKPTSNATLEFGRKFRITNIYSRNSFIAPTWPGELYWNFGAPGIVIGLGLLGAGARWAYRRYGTPGLGVVPRAICMLVMVDLLMLLENHIAASIVGAIRPLIMLEVIRMLGRHHGLIVRDPVEVVAPT